MLIEYFYNKEPDSFIIDKYNVCPVQWPDYNDWPNLITQSFDKRIECCTYTSALSIKLAIGGNASYLVDGKRKTINDSTFLIVNNSQQVKTIVESEKEVESFSIFFQPEFVNNVFAALKKKNEFLLDEWENTDGKINFYDKVYNYETNLISKIMKVREKAGKNQITKGWLEEQLYFITHSMVETNYSLKKEIVKISAAKSTTRQELYRRLHIAKDFIDSSYSEKINIPVIAKQAMLSPYHFLRLFKNFFGVTPHQYLTGKRMQKAKELAVSGTLTVTEISEAVGFESLAAFSLLFKKHFNCSPSSFIKN